MMSKVNQLGKDFQRMARGSQPSISMVRRKVTPASNLSVPNGQPHHPGPIQRQPSGDAIEDDEADGEMDDTVQWNWRDDAKFNCFMREIYDVSTGMRKLATIHQDHHESVERNVLEYLSDYVGIIHTLPTLVRLHEEAMEAYNTSKEKDTKKEAEEVRQHCETINNIILAEFDHFSETMVGDFETIILNLLKEQATFHRHVAKSWDSLYEGYANRRASNLPQTERITSSGKTFSFDRSGSFTGSFASSRESSGSDESSARNSDADVTPQPPDTASSPNTIPTYINVQRMDPKRNTDSWEKSGDYESDPDKPELEESGRNELYESVIVHDDNFHLEEDDKTEEAHSYANLEIMQHITSPITKSAPTSPLKPRKPMPIKRTQGSDGSSLTSSLEITNSSESNSSPVLKMKKPPPPVKPSRPILEDMLPTKQVKPSLSVSTPFLNQLLQKSTGDNEKFLTPKLSPQDEKRPRTRSNTTGDSFLHKKQPMLPPGKPSRELQPEREPLKETSSESKITTATNKQEPVAKEREVAQKTISYHPPLKPRPSDPGGFRSKVMSMHEASSQGGREELMRKLSLRRQRLDQQLGAHKLPLAKHKPNVGNITEIGSERNSTVSTASSEVVVVKYNTTSTPDETNGSHGNTVPMRKHDDSLAKYGILEDTESGSFII